MKKNIHPKWMQSTVVCACGNTFMTGGTKQMLRVEVCSKCHPFFTGQQRIVDTAGQVERFMRRAAKAAGAKPTPVASAAAETAEVGGA
jgi:large subunit ribosomal protein L31